MAGKPKKPGEVKAFMLRVRMTEEERKLLEEAAKVKSLGLSTWTRFEMLALARRVLASKGR
jgi:uncharacterized protein (DUF1778 family)